MNKGTKYKPKIRAAKAFVGRHLGFLVMWPIVSTCTDSSGPTQHPSVSWHLTIEDSNSNVIGSIVADTSEADFIDSALPMPSLNADRAAYTADDTTAQLYLLLDAPANIDPDHFGNRRNLLRSPHHADHADYSASSTTAALPWLNLTSPRPVS